MSYFGALWSISILWLAPWTFASRRVFPFLDLGGFFFFFRIFPFPLDKRSTWAGGESDLVSYRNVCCFLTLSDCFRISLESSYSCSESFLSFIPTTILPQMRSSLSFECSKFAVAKQYKSVMKLTTDPPFYWLLKMKLARSNITFLFTTKWASNFHLLRPSNKSKYSLGSRHPFGRFQSLFEIFRNVWSNGTILRFSDSGTWYLAMGICWTMSCCTAAATCGCAGWAPASFGSWTTWGCSAWIPASCVVPLI